ncbi:hypothetical protein JZ751_006005 [Albula glossodonta]|uniref:Uncharacterized protein n=1 Tax=Albula glossodonta TaxID=121402 RepID=A0A8T2PC47_9TELE|nr:hypothetical protein JZ751_006005 [Albula glossodonta]
MGRDWLGQREAAVVLAGSGRVDETRGAQDLWQCDTGDLYCSYKRPLTQARFHACGTLPGRISVGLQNTCQTPGPAPSQPSLWLVSLQPLRQGELGCRCGMALAWGLIWKRDEIGEKGGASETPGV